MIMEVLKVRLCFSVLIRFLNKIGLVGLVSMGGLRWFLFLNVKKGINMPFFSFLFIF